MLLTRICVKNCWIEKLVKINMFQLTVMKISLISVNNYLNCIVKKKTESKKNDQIVNNNNI